jgi:hypothetical protein
MEGRSLRCTHAVSDSKFIAKRHVMRMHSLQ